MRFGLSSQRCGSTLLLALIILGGLVATSLTVGTIVVTRLRGVKAIDDSVLASYAAETGVEELLYAVRKEERCDVNGTLGVSRNGACVSLSARGTLERNGATWERTVGVPPDMRAFELPQDHVEQIDLSSWAGNPISVVTLRLMALAPPDTHAWLEVAWVPWLNAGEWVSSDRRVLLGFSELRDRAVNNVPLTVPANSVPMGYRVRMRAIGGDIGRLEVYAFKSDGTSAAAFDARITATVVGTMGSAQYATRVEFPASFPLAPVFDYVLFSECDIVKGGTITCP